MEKILDKDGVSVYITENNEIKVENLSKNKLRLVTKKPNSDFNEYVNFHFNPGIFIITHPPKWTTTPTNDKVNLLLFGEDFYYDYIISLKNKTIKDVTKKWLTIDNFEIVKERVSVIISAYKTEKYIKETILSLHSLKNDYFDIEIIVGIDGDQKVLMEILDYDYPKEVSFYLFEENVGLFHSRNTMVLKSKYDKLLFFDSDDIPHLNLFENLIKYFKEYDIVRWFPISFNDGDDYRDDTKIKLSKNLLCGCFGIKKQIFLDNNGFQPWRAHGDTEFNLRVDKNYKTIILNDHLFYYRIRKESLSRDKQTRDGSLLRETYKRIIEEKINNNSFKNPERLYTRECLWIK